MPSRVSSVISKDGVVHSPEPANVPSIFTFLALQKNALHVRKDEVATWSLCVDTVNTFHNATL